MIPGRKIKQNRYLFLATFAQWLRTRDQRGLTRPAMYVVCILPLGKDVYLQAGRRSIKFKNWIS